MDLLNQSVKVSRSAWAATKQVQQRVSEDPVGGLATGADSKEAEVRSTQMLRQRRPETRIDLPIRLLVEPLKFARSLIERD